MNKHWISIHIFYSSNANPLIVDCLAPLIDLLRKRGLIRRYFFIKYWMEGPHVRLRLLLAEGVEEEEVKRVIEPVIAEYLQRRPALYDLDSEQFRAFHKDMFIAEYGKEIWVEKYGEDGEMPLRANNSFHYIEYEPEYLRYGGVEGVELAEWHFEKSSDIVIRLLRDTNVPVRTIMLGLSTQLSLPLCFGFLEDDQRVIDFLINYLKYWQETFHKESLNLHADFDKKYDKMAVELQRRIAEVRRYIVDNTPGSLTVIEREWAAHIRELRARIDALVLEEKLIFQGKGEDGEAIGPITRLDYAYYQVLLSGYIHMTNNRLGVSILDEIYLSYILKRTLEERILHATVQEVLV
ncbi:MAG: lantibiotic dehydratase C-terminal domain-containing protein [Ktedonobacteraceae bacterium]